MTIREYIKKRIETLKEEYKKSRDFHQEAMKAYGSELSAGDMMQEEQTLLSEIDRLQCLLKAPEVDKSKEDLESLLGQTLDKIVSNDGAQAALAAENEKLQKYKSLIEELKKIHLKAAA